MTATAQEPTPVADLDAITAVPTEKFVVEDVECVVRRLRAKEFLALLRVLSTGLGQGLREIRLNFDDEEGLQSEMLALLMLAIPEASDEFMSFIRLVVEPKEPNEQNARTVGIAMANPEPSVLIDVAEAIVTQEKDDLVALAGKAQAALRRMQGLFEKPMTKTTT